MPRSHGDSASAAALADWEARAFTIQREHAAEAASTPVDDALPDDALANPTATRSALRGLERS